MTCGSHVTDRGGLASGPEARKELRRKRDESLHTVLVLLSLFVRRGFGGICRNHDTGSMLWGMVDSFEREGRSRLCMKNPRLVFTNH